MVGLMRFRLGMGIAFFLGGCTLGQPPKPFADEVPSSPPIARLEQSQKSRVLFLNTNQPKVTPGSVPLRSGERVITDRGGSAQIVFDSRARTRLASDSKVMLQSGQSFKLEQGSLLVSSPDFLQIETYWGRITAKNAVFYLTFNPDRWQMPQILVLRGKVHNFILDSDVKVILSPGEELNITPFGIPLPVKKLNNIEKRRLLQTIKQQFRFNDRLPAEVVFLEQWQLPETKPKPTPTPVPYQPPVYSPPEYPYYEELPPYAPPTIVRATPPAPPPPVVAEPPPLPLEPEVIPPEPEVIPIEVPVVTETIPLESSPDEDPQ